MLELNTDRMLFAIGAVILGAALLFGAINGFPNMMSMWGFGMANSVNSVEVAAGSDVAIQNHTFDAFSQGWNQSDGSVVFDGETVYVPAGEEVSTRITIPNNSSVRVSFKARGTGSTNVQIAGESTLSSTSNISLFDEMYTYTATLMKVNEQDNLLVFAAPADSELIIDEVSVTYMGELEQ